MATAKNKYHWKTSAHVIEAWYDSDRRGHFFRVIGCWFHITGGGRKGKDVDVDLTVYRKAGKGWHVAPSYDKIEDGSIWSQEKLEDLLLATSLRAGSPSIYAFLRGLQVKPYTAVCPSQEKTPMLPARTVYDHLLED